MQCTPIEGDCLEHLSFLAALAGTLQRDMTVDEIKENLEEVSKVKVKEIAGMYDLCCFER